MALGFLLATLVAMLLSAAPAGAAVPAGKAFAWGDNFYGQLGHGVFGTDTDVPVGVNNLSNVISIDGGFGLTLAATQ